MRRRDAADDGDGRGMRGEDAAQPGAPDDCVDEAFSDAPTAQPGDRDHAQGFAKYKLLCTVTCGRSRPLGTIKEEDHNFNERTPTPSNDFTMGRLLINETAITDDEDTLDGDASGGIIPPNGDIKELFRPSSPLLLSIPLSTDLSGFNARQLLSNHS